MKRALIASIAALGIVATPALATTSTPAPAKVTKAQKKAAKVGPANQKVAAKTALKTK
jgi:hypothetical protein